jgi:hypothetical protein
MIKAIKTVETKTEMELETPFYYNHTNEKHSFTMIGIVTNNSIMEITIEKFPDDAVQAYEFTINDNPQPEDVYPYMWENKITKEEFNNLYYSVMTDISLSHIITEGNT